MAAYDPRLIQSTSINLLGQKGYAPAASSKARLYTKGTKQAAMVADSDVVTLTTINADGTGTLLGTYPVNNDGGAALNAAL